MINYYLITKPGIILGNLFTVAAGFLLASKGVKLSDAWLFLATLAGLTLIMASACIFNNYIDRQTDRKMERTKQRALAAGLVSSRNAIGFAVLLGLAGGMVLLTYTNILTFLVAGVGFFVYVVLYSLWKCRTIYGTAIGSIAGAVPPVVGYCAVSNSFDLGAAILFAMMVLWQMPHFFSIAILHYDDYVSAQIPVLPVKKGLLRTKIHMVVYILAFIAVAGMLTLFNYTGYVYLLVTLLISGCWLALCMKGFSSNNDKLWGRDMFRLSLLLISIICFAIPFDVI
jgi:heme o synthase